MTRRPTIKEVASAAGVSTQTISRVINGRPDVSPETRKRVQAIIQKMGYQPSALARSLIQQRSYTLGVVTAGLNFIGPSRTLNGITRAAEEAGYALLLKELPHYTANDILPLFQALLSRHVDGIIWAVPEIGDNRNWVNDLSLDLSVPIVYITMEPREGISIVSVNNYLGGRMAVSHLIEQGYRHIGHISGPLEWWESRNRMAAWRDALREAGLEAHEEHWREGNWSSTSGVQAANRLFKQYPELDSIFAANDQMALGAMRSIRDEGLRIPEDIAVVGFDNIAESAFFCPSLTTIQQDQHNVGALAVEEVIKVIEAQRNDEDYEPRTIMLTPKLVVRESSKREGGGRKGNK